MINSKNVGRIAERIVANELEFRGFRVSDLNKEGTAANADLLAVSPTQTLQIQVKGTANGPKDRWWAGYGFCNERVIAGVEPMFNRLTNNFYAANFVVLVAVRSPQKYRCFVLPIKIAEKAAQLNLDGDYRIPTRAGEPKKPHRMYIELERSPRARTADRWAEERDLVVFYEDEQGWSRLLQSN
jgi:hypothetical protein